ncbi:hypothetical protein NQ314_008448 [Rhamnusium bicolor]|uniref:Transposase zinc-binding domain-containing protein n=1 Tax=Rhamnusium bicolor TaxID=1586634 RepID=A0AAV8YBK8_9CUCU|nr:hypothetical protein NQ314_008448 [Rhamnusium bicolor]
MASLWPILIQIKNIEILKSRVIMVGLYYGNEKPKFVNEYLRDFVNEAINLIQNGMCIEKKRYKFRIKMLTCDVPAKSYMLCIKGHTAYYSCTKCKQEGK